MRLSGRSVTASVLPQHAYTGQSSQVKHMNNTVCLLCSSGHGKVTLGQSAGKPKHNVLAEGRWYLQVSLQSMLTIPYNSTLFSFTLQCSHLKLQSVLWWEVSEQSFNVIFQNLWSAESWRSKTLCKTYDDGILQKENKVIELNLVPWATPGAPPPYQWATEWNTIGLNQMAGSKLVNTPPPVTEEGSHCMQLTVAHCHGRHTPSEWCLSLF